MFILIISRGIPSKRYPQWGCFEKDQAEALASIGHKVVVVSVDGRFRFIYRKRGLTHVVINGVDYYNHYLLPHALVNLFGRQMTLRLQNWQIDRVYDMVEKCHGKPDIIYAQMFGNMLLGVHLSQRLGVPVVGIEHLARFNEQTLDKWGFTKNEADYAYHNIHKLISVSQTLRDAIYRHFRVDSVVVHNLVGNEFSYQPNNTSHPLTFVTTGSLIHRKGFDLLIEALRKVNSQLPEGWQCNIIGGGEKQAELQQQIDQAQLQEHIHLVGQKNKQEIVQLLQQSDVFVLPSRSENFSVAVLEALACGLPVIASICGGIRECIEEHNGLLFPVDDTEALANAILHMATHLSNYDRQAIAADCQARFSPEVIARKLTDIFDKVLADNATQ